MKKIGKEVNGLYWLHKQPLERNKSLCLAINNTQSDSNIELWNKRLGHTSSSILKKIFPVNVQYITTKVNKCNVCPYAKQARNPFPSSITSTVSIFELVHIDLWGPYKVDTFDRNNFFLAIVDEYSRMTWTFLLKHKSDVCVCLQYFLNFVQCQFDKNIKILRSNNGTEFINFVCYEMFKSLGIIHQKTYPYTPHQNSIAERKHRHILEVTRAIRFEGKVPLKYWGHCVLASVYLINRLPSSVLRNKSPYKKPFLAHLRVIGYLCYAKLIQERNKLLPSPYGLLRSPKSIYFT